MIGDSLMSGFGLSPGETAWPALVAETSGAEVIDLACAGAGFVAFGDCGTPYAGLVARAIAADPDVVVIQSTDNDFGYNPEWRASAAGGVLRSLREGLPNARIVAFGTVVYDGESGADEVAATSAELQAATLAAGGSFESLGQPLQGHPELMQDDDEHPTAAGQRVLADAAIEALRRAGALRLAPGSQPLPKSF